MHIREEWLTVDGAGALVEEEAAAAEATLRAIARHFAIASANGNPSADSILHGAAGRGADTASGLPPSGILPGGLFPNGILPSGSPSGSGGSPFDLWLSLDNGRLLLTNTGGGTPADTEGGTRTDTQGDNARLRLANTGGGTHADTGGGIPADAKGATRADTEGGTLNTGGGTNRDQFTDGIEGFSPSSNPTSDTDGATTPSSRSLSSSPAPSLFSTASLPPLLLPNFAVVDAIDGFAEKAALLACAHR